MAKLKVQHLLVLLASLCVAKVTPGACPIDNWVGQHVSRDFRQCQCEGTPLKTTKIVCKDQGFQEHAGIQMLASLSNSSDLLDSLEELHFTGNDVNVLFPNIIGNTQQGVFWEMKILDLSDNNIGKISGKTFHATPDLETLILDDNEWYVTDRAPRIFSSFFELKTLSLNNAFSSSPDTKDVDIQVSTLTDVFEGSEMYWLEYLYLERNALVEVHQSIFQSLPSLRLLSLAHNQIMSVHDIWNSSCHEKTYYTEVYNERCLLETLDLSDNKINVIPMSLINELQLMSSFSSLNISGNPLHCDCNMAPFVIWLQSGDNKQKVHQADSLVCNTPSKLTDTKLLELHPNKLTCGPERSQLETDKHTSGATIALAVIFSLLALLLIIVLVVNRRLVMETVGKGVGAVRDAACPRKYSYTGVSV